jgi:hypothetical protein
VTRYLRVIDFVSYNQLPTDFPPKLSIAHLPLRRARISLAKAPTHQLGPDVADANRIFLSPKSTSKPSDLYNVLVNRCTAPGYRFVRSTNPHEMLMFVDGSALNNGSPNARAGS